MGPQRLPPLPLAGPRCTSSRISAAAAPPLAEPAEPPPPRPSPEPPPPPPRSSLEHGCGAVGAPSRRAGPGPAERPRWAAASPSSAAARTRPRRPQPAARSPPPAQKAGAAGGSRSVSSPFLPPPRRVTAPPPARGREGGGEGPAEAGRAAGPRWRESDTWRERGAAGRRESRR